MRDEPRERSNTHRARQLAVLVAMLAGSVLVLAGCRRDAPDTTIPLAETIRLHDDLRAALERVRSLRAELDEAIDSLVALPDELSGSRIDVGLFRHVLASCFTWEIDDRPELDGSGHAPSVESRCRAHRIDVLEAHLGTLPEEVQRWARAELARVDRVRVLLKREAPRAVAELAELVDRSAAEVARLRDVAAVRRANARSDAVGAAQRRQTEADYDEFVRVFEAAETTLADLRDIVRELQHRRRADIDAVARKIATFGTPPIEDTPYLR